MEDSISEKSGRGNLFTATTRALGPERIVICDSLNYIKGFRYQMYCAAREAHSRTVTVRQLPKHQGCFLTSPGTRSDPSGQMQRMAREARRVFVQARYVS
jgi:tRNA uridine 5-carbamoylmethylation protein Kti12